MSLAMNQTIMCDLMIHPDMYLTFMVDWVLNIKQQTKFLNVLI